MVYAALFLFHLIFFWQAYSKPISMARSELLSTFFPSWLYLGRQVKEGACYCSDKHFWLNYRAHPVLSSYYPIHVLTAWIGSHLSLNGAFRLLVYSSLFHIFIASVGWFLLINTWAGILISAFGAITLTYSAYNIKQQPCILYTIAWFPWLLYGIAVHSTPIASVACGLSLLAGYYPVGIQTLAISFFASLCWSSTLWWIPIGFLLGSVQLIPFLRYLPKTIRANCHDGIGKVPPWHFLSLILPKLFRKNINGVGYWEMTYYVGIVPLILPLLGPANQISRAWALGVVSSFLMIGLFSRHLPRIPARFSFSFQFALGWVATTYLSGLNLSYRTIMALILIQALDLYWNNSELLVTRPYSELQNAPNRAFNTRITRFFSGNGQNWRISGLPYPLFTGHVNKLLTLGYSGGMQLKLMAKFRGDKNPNGSGEHDWFKNNADDPKLDGYRVRYAYTSKKLDWKPTPIRHLWENPRLQHSPSGL